MIGLANNNNASHTLEPTHYMSKLLHFAKKEEFSLMKWKIEIDATKRQDSKAICS